MLETIFNPNGYLFWVITIGVIAGAVIIISRPFSTYIKFVYPNAKFEAMGNPYLGEKNLNILVESKNIKAFKEILNSDKDYKLTGETVKEIQHSLDQNFINFIDMMKKDSSKKMYDFYEIYLQKNDNYVIKRELKNKLKGLDIPKEVFDEIVLSSSKMFLEDLKEKELDELPALFKKHGYSDRLIEIIEKDNINYLEFDTEFDKKFIQDFNKIKVPYKCKDAKNKYVKTLVDILNIKNVLRAKQINYDNKNCLKLFISEGQEIAIWKYEELADTKSVLQVMSSLEGTTYYDGLKDSIEEYKKENSLYVLEKALDFVFLKNIVNISTQNYSSIGPTLRFLISKEFEIRNLKIITKAVNEQLSSDLVKKYLLLEAKQ